MMNPMNVSKNPRTMNGPRRRVRSEEKARMSSITAPVMFGATVYKFVLIVEKPNLATICGRNRETD